MNKRSWGQKLFALGVTAVFLGGITLFQNCGPLPDPKDTDSGSSSGPTPEPTPSPTPTPAPVETRVIVNSSMLQASSEYAGGQVANANDGNLNTAWNSGGPAPAFIRFNLTEPIRMTRIEMILAQLPNGQSSHEIWVGPTAASLHKVQDLDGNVISPHTFNITMDEANVQVVEIRTTNELPSMSWVAWIEIRIFETN